MKKLTKIAFLDRDGVINSSKVNNGYVGLIKDFKWIPGSRKAIKYLKNLGYKVVVVLSGLHNNLRRQTQIRFEEGVSGWNTQTRYQERPFCGASNPAPENIDPYSLKIGHMTTRDDRGDLLANNEPGLMLGAQCVYSISKKNYRTLENLIKFFRNELEGVGRNLSVPLLLIDDEADNASIFLSVCSLGCVPVFIAAFSAGNPKESKPIGVKTPSPLIVRYRTRRSPMV